MQTVYIGNTLINDVMLGSQRMDDVFSTIPSLDIDWLAVGGGASGGAGNFTRSGGGGGAGRFVSSSINIPQSTSIAITIGAGGIAPTAPDNQGRAGGNTTIQILGTTYTSPGGGGGGDSQSATFAGDGLSGGSGGGGGATGTTGGNTTNGGSNVSGTPIAGFGNDGQGKSSNSGNTPGGNGGGAGGTPTGYAWIDGITYCVGGGSGATEYGSGGNGNTGDGSVGIAGISKIRYAGTPKATGGTITQSGGYTYHTFTSSGTFTY